MSVILRNTQIPLFIKIETGSLGRLQQILEEHHLNFKRPLVVSEEHILKLGGNDVIHALGDPATILYQENSIKEGSRIASEVREKGNDVMVGIGGGRVLDLVKYAATKANVNYISIPTSPSNDGICSPISVLTNEDGLSESLGVNMPIGILADTHMLTSAPKQNIQAGIGDLISNFSAIHDWNLAYIDNKDRVDDFAASMSYSAAQLIFETCRGSSVDLTSEEFLHKLVHGLILSGIAMNIAGSSRPCSGAEHEISHAIDALFPGTSIHGLQVAFGTLFAGYMRDESIEHLVGFFRCVGLPLLHTDFGLTNKEFAQVLLKAPETRPERYTILEKTNLNEGRAHSLIESYITHIKELTDEK